MTPTINVLLSTFPGLNLPDTLCLPLPSTLTTEDLSSLISALLPSCVAAQSRLRLVSTGGGNVTRSRAITLADLAKSSSCSLASTCSNAALLPLRLSATLVGGKGGFGSQLRAAGGRMSSRKRKQNAELANGSARNLDGRRLRTIAEAKNLATYLATKPEMDRKEKEERRKRWEAVVDLAEQREADMRAGKGQDGRRKGLSEEWVEEKEEVGENVKTAVKKAMLARTGGGHTATTIISDGESSGNGGSAHDSDNQDSDNEDLMELDGAEMERLMAEAEAGDVDAIWVLKNQLKIPVRLLPPKKGPPRFAGFDEDDDDHSSSSDEETVQNNSAKKGKAKVGVL